ncbi:SLBB domain-containing protein [Flexibacterium corallicola]|uniref:SLBB domain-containing protein n=1 Tax=Flexibacterium corallicola TaxID=3037259 RepID=UPI00286F858E|nr:SLBB domain-containing protein [Pseudovibrio sp. M1P-2-3]
MQSGHAQVLSPISKPSQRSVIFPEERALLLSQTATSQPTTVSSPAVNPAPSTPSSPDDRKLQFGDEVKVTMPGEDGFENPFPIDQHGNIELPEVGSVNLIGLTQEEAQNKVREVLSQAFRNLDRLEVSLGRRQLLITVLGYVINPGQVILPENANVQTAVTEAGGIRQGAQLDAFQLRRDDKVIRFDFKRYLDTGDPKALPELQSLDTLFIPASPLIGNVEVNFDGRWLAEAGDGGDEVASIRVLGEVNNPASFAYKDDSNIIDFIMRAGGVTRYASVEQIRIINKGDPVLFNLQMYLDTGNPDLLVKLEPGATIYVPTQKDEIQAGKSTIYIMGEVAKPGAYEGREDATFIDIIGNAGGPTRFADTLNIRLIKADGTVEMINLAAYTEGKVGKLPQIAGGDAIFVPEKLQNNEPNWLRIPPDKAVEIIGAVAKPGRYEWSDEMNLFNLLAHAGGPTSAADTSNIQILLKEGDWAKSVRFNLKGFLENGGSMSEVPRLRAGAVVLLPDKGAQETTADTISVTLLGYVQKPGVYNLPSTTNVQLAVTEASGLRQGAQLDSFQLIRDGKSRTFSYKRYLDTGDLKQLPELQDGDELFIPASTVLGNVEVNFDGRTLMEQGDGADASTAISVFGEVNTPARYAFEEGQSVIDYLMRAGGLTRYAGLQQIKVINGGTPEQFNLEHYLETANEGSLIKVEPGATIFVPQQVDDIRAGSNTVYVMGEVAKPGAFESRANASFIEIIANSGGPTRYADTSQIRLIRGDGTVETVNLLAYTEQRISTLPEVDPGDAIFVPEKTEIEEPSWLRVPPERSIEIIGAVIKPGRYDWSDEMTIFDLIGEAGGPSGTADTSQIQILDRTNNNAVATRFDLKKFMSQGGRLAAVPKLSANTTIFIPNKVEDEDDEDTLNIKVLGFVNNPGLYQVPESTNVQLAIAQADGLRLGAQLDILQIRRKGKTRVFNYREYLDTGDEVYLPQLQDGDEIFVPSSTLLGNIEVNVNEKDLIEKGNKDSVKVFGEVQSPAPFPYQDDLTILDFIMLAGGISKDADIQEIRVINDTIPIIFDLQRYLDTANPDDLVKIGPGATIFIPPISDNVKSGDNFVYIVGEVAQPGALETKPETSFMEILATAGGPTRFADTRQVKVLRENGDVEVIDLLTYTEGGDVVLPEIESGDTIFIPEKTEVNEVSWLKIPPERAIEIIGAVYKPGRYEWSSEMTFIDLFAEAGGPTATADISSVNVIYQRGDRAVSIKFDIDKFIREGGDLSQLPKLEAGALIVVSELPTDPTDQRAIWLRQASEDSIYIMGAVGAPGRYAFNSDMHFLDIVSAANGPTVSADMRNIRVTHRGEYGSRVSKVNLALYFETGDDSILPRVKNGDVIYIPDQDREWLDLSKEKSVRVLGAVAKPGRYEFSDSMTILDLLAEAGGPTSNALVEKILVVNLSCCRDQAQLFDLLDFAKRGDMKDLPVVREGDTVYVPDISRSNWRQIFDKFQDIVAAISVYALFSAI